MLETARQDLRYAVRALRCVPGFTFIAIASLGVCIAAGSLVFGLALVLLGAPKPVMPVRDRSCIS